MSVGHRREDGLGQQRAEELHLLLVARRAEPLALARERQQILVLAVVAAHAGEPLGEIPAVLTLQAAGQAGVDPAALDRLVSAAEAKQSDALFVHQHGKPVHEAFFKSKDKRIYLFSVTKAFTGLAVGIAWDR